jgi:hypothetical protein
VKHWPLWMLFAVLSAAALVSSLGTAFQTLPLNPDMAEMALIYQGIVHHGWRFPFTWRFTQDNQILSLLPFALMFYALAGVSGASIIVQGWLIFVVNAMLTGLLVKVSTKSWRWAGLAWLLSLLASPMAIGQPAILAYPVTHNSVWTFGLLGAISLIRYFTDRPRWALPLLLVCVGVGTISDPWFDAAFTAPILLLAWKSPKWFQTDKTTQSALIKSIIITYIAGRIAYFGLELLHMVPGRSIGFASLSAMLHHLVLLAKSTGMLLQLYPFPSGELVWMLWSVYLVALCSAVILAFQPRQQISLAVKVLLAFSGLSTGIIATAFVLTNFANGIWASRFLINFFYLFIAAFVAFSAAAWPTSGYLLKFLLLTSLIGYIAFWISAIHHTNWRYTTNWGGARSLATWLVENDLHNGYGQYFDANTPILNIASHHKITARPLSCNMGYLIPRLSSGDDQFWFDKSALSGLDTPQFILFDKTDRRWTRCATTTFGPPDEKLKYHSFDVWIYHHSLSQKLMVAQQRFKDKWELINTANNRKAITKVGETLGISSEWAQNTYTWLLANKLAK